MNNQNKPKILKLLKDLKVEISISQIASALDISYNTVEKHLSVLVVSHAVIMRKTARVGINPSKNVYIFNSEHFSPSKKSAGAGQPIKTEISQFVNTTPKSGKITLPRTAPPMDTVYKPIRSVNYVPSNRAFLTSGQGKYAGELK